MHTPAPSQSPQCLPGVPRPLLLSHWDRQAPPFASSLSPEGSKACFSTPRPEGGKVASEAVNATDATAPEAGLRKVPNPHPAQAQGRLLQGPHFSVEGLPEALLMEDSPALVEQPQPDGVINNLVAKGVINLSPSIPCASKTPEPSQAPLRQLR